MDRCRKEAFLDIVGYNRQEFEERFSGRDFTSTEHVESSRHVMEQSKKTGVGGPYEKEFLRKDGTKAWMMIIAADSGDYTPVEYAIDISDRKKAEEALGRLMEQLEGQVKESTAMDTSLPPLKKGAGALFTIILLLKE